MFLDKGSLKNPNSQELEDTTKILLNYFFVGVTLPNDTFWVNLRPDAEDNIIDAQLAQTDVGKILLESDLQLKKDTAKFTSPDTPEGREYWDKLYQKAGELFGSSNITIPTLTRPWIVPDEIIIRETTDSAYIYKATLKVMLEQDYLKDSAVYNFKDERLKELNEYSSQLIREIIIPKLTKEVNYSKRYASLRQVYYSLIMAQWFKTRFQGEQGKYYGLINSRNLQNLNSKEPWSKTFYFKDYQKSFKDGEYNIKEPIYTPYGQTIRTYFSGGISGIAPSMPPFGEAAFTDSKTGANITCSPASSPVIVDPNVVIGVGVTATGKPIELKEVKIKETSSPIFAKEEFKIWLQNIIPEELTKEIQSLELLTSLINNLQSSGYWVQAEAAAAVKSLAEAGVLDKEIFKARIDLSRLEKPVPAQFRYYYLRLLEILRAEPVYAYQILNWPLEELLELFQILDFFLKGLALDIGYKTEAAKKHSLEQEFIKSAPSSLLSNPKDFISHLREKIKIAITDKSLKLAIKVYEVASVNAARA